MKPNFLPVQFESSKKLCPLPFAVTVERLNVKFRLSSELVAECKAKRNDLMSLYYDHGASLFALVSDPKNESGEARKLNSTSSKNSKGVALTVSFPRTDLLKRIWTKQAAITGVPLFERRGPGKIVFHAPVGK